MYISYITSFLIRQQQKNVSTQKKDITKTCQVRKPFLSLTSLFSLPLCSPQQLMIDITPDKGTLCQSILSFAIWTPIERGEEQTDILKGCSCYFLQQEYNHRHPPTHCCLLKITITCKGTQCPCHNIIQSTTCPIYIDRRTQREKDRKVIMRRFQWISLLKMILSITWILSLFIICPLSMVLWSRMDKHPSLWDGSNG